tara:strand:- start:446 stop:757 length:312 start_codon:yes stop_codon:yes gene_type:complete
MSKQLLIEPADVNKRYMGKVNMPTKIVAHQPTGSWYTISREERWTLLLVAPITKSEMGLPLEDEWVQVSCLADLTTKEYEDLRQMLNKEFPNDDIDDIMYRCL